MRSNYEVIRLYFLEILRVDYKTATQQARQLEPHLSEASLAAMRYAVDHNDDWDELARLVPA